MLGEFLQGFGINLKLLFAQLVNFAILFFIFKKWLLKPIWEILEKRKNIIEDGIKKSQEIEQKLLKIEELKKKEMEKIRVEIERIIENSKKRGEALEKEILLDAEKKAEKILMEARAKIDLEKERLRDDLKKEFASLLILSLEKILKKEYSQVDKIRILREVKEKI